MVQSKRSPALEKGVLNFLKKFARNEYDFTKANVIELEELTRAITNFFTERERKNIEIENKSLIDFQKKLLQELRFRKMSYEELRPSERVALAKREHDIQLKEKDKKILDFVGDAIDYSIQGVEKAIKAKTGISLPIPKDENPKYSNEKIVDVIHSLPKNPIDLIQTVANKIIIGSQDPVKQSFDDYISKQTSAWWKKDKKRAATLQMSLFFGAKGHQQLLEEAKKSFFEDTGIKIN